MSKMSFMFIIKAVLCALIYKNDAIYSNTLEAFHLRKSHRRPFMGKTGKHLPIPWVSVYP
jgi:hypothetical protein